MATLRDKIKLAQNQVRDLMEKKERLKKDKRQLAETVKQRQEESKSLMQVVVGLKDRRRATEEKISVLRRARQRETSLLQLQNLHCFLSRADAAAQAPGEDDSEDLNNQKETLVGRLVELAEQYEAKLLPRRLAWAENSELSGKIKEQSRSQRSLQQRRASLLKSRREERELYSPPTLVVGEGANSVGEEYLSPSKAKEWFRVQEIPATPHHRSFLTDQIVSPLEQSPKNEVVKPSTPTKQTSAQNGKKLDISVGDDGRDAFHAAYHGGLIFKRDKFLGAGAFGRVFLVFTEDGLPLAMKQIRLPLASDGYDPDDVLRECNILKGLSHRNIVSAHHVDVDSESVKLFMEYLPLGSVKQLISQQGPLKELACRNYIRQALRGVEYLHNNFIIHGDLKAANMLVSADGIIKLADFGCSFRFESMPLHDGASETRPLMGSVPWMAPELIIGSKPRCARADIWAMGITLIEMCTGNHPWRNQQNILSLAWHIADLIRKPSLRPMLPLCMSAEAKEFLDRCLDLEPDGRWSATALTSHPFLAFDRRGNLDLH